MKQNKVNRTIKGKKRPIKPMTKHDKTSRHRKNTAHCTRQWKEQQRKHSDIWNILYGTDHIKAKSTTAERVHIRSDITDTDVYSAEVFRKQTPPI